VTTIEHVRIGAGSGAEHPLVEVDDLTVAFRDDGTLTRVVEGVSFALAAGECLALVGESGSGKSVTARTLIGLAGDGADVSASALRVAGTDPSTLSTTALRAFRGAKVGYVLQDALVSLDPLRTIEQEVGDALRIHRTVSKPRRAARVQELLTRVGVPQPEIRARQRSGELSGGLRQRALIASAIALDPPVLIADEPTTALDATVQEQILGLLEELKASGAAILLISHDLAVVGRIADRIAVMKAGTIVETGPAERVLTAPEHEYTKRLIQAVPADRPRGTRLSPDPVGVQVRERETKRPALPASEVVLDATGLRKSYRGPDGADRLVVDDVSFSLRRGTTLGLVGESGSGKTTTARIALGITTPDEGRVELLDGPWSELRERERRARRPLIGSIYQDPLSSFDPRLTVGRILGDAVTGGAGGGGRAGGRGATDAEIRELLDAVGLPAGTAARRPRHLSGGQRQRVAIARAIAPRPEVIVCDEPVSALDVSVQAQVLDLLDELQRALGMSYLFISHDLGVIQHMSDEVAVMSEGRIVEHGAAREVFERPQHPYTQRLLAASPRLVG
jgi:peptide/nickel transport system ATP-binding protein